MTYYSWISTPQNQSDSGYAICNILHNNLRNEIEITIKVKISSDYVNFHLPLYVITLLWNDYNPNADFTLGRKEEAKPNNQHNNNYSYPNTS